MNALVNAGVVIPCYNAERYLGDAIDSVLAQSVSGPVQVRLIVVDDGSQDDSVAVAETYAGRLTVLQQANQGTSVARNLGIVRALEEGAELLAFLDADDLWTPGSLAARLGVMEAHPDVGVVAGLTEQFVSPDISADRRASMAPTLEPVPGRVAGAMLVRREVFERVGLFDPTFRLGETMDWVARATLARVSFHALDRVVQRRRVHDRNSVHEASRLHAEYLRVLKVAMDRRRQMVQQAG